MEVIIMLIPLGIAVTSGSLSYLFGKVINLKPDEQAIIAVTTTVIAELAVGVLFYNN